MLINLSRLSLIVHREPVSLYRNASYFQKLLKKDKEWESEHELPPTTTGVTFGRVDDQKYKAIYSHRFIRYPAAFVKLKYPLGIGLVVASPIAYFAHENESLSLLIAFTCVNQLLIIRILELFCKNMVGAIYVNRTNEDEVVISSLGKNGKRINMSHDFKDVVCYGFRNKLNKLLGIADVCINGKDIVYKLLIRDFRVHDKEMFSSLFGEIKSLK